MGIAYLVQKFEIGTKDVKNYFEILTYYNKRKINFKWKSDYEHSFKKACELVSGDSDGTTFESIIGDDIELDLTIGVHHIFHSKENMEDYREASHNIIGNMCWFLVQYDTFQKNADKWAKNLSNKHFTAIRVSKELIEIGTKFGQNVLKNVLQKEEQRVQEILSQ